MTSRTGSPKHGAPGEGNTPATDVPDGLAGKTVLLTGGAGFIGSHLAERLVEACSVRVFDDLSTGTASAVPSDAQLRRGDVRDEGTVLDAVDGVDVVFHQAGLVSVVESVENPREAHTANATGTLQVLEAARREDARVVLASSAAVYGQPGDVPVPESAPKRPRSPYGVAKLSADHYARMYNDLYGLPTVVLRYFNVYGSARGGENAGVVASFLRQARAGGPLTVHGDGTQTRDFVHVSDVVRANLRAGVTDGVGTAFNVGTGTAHSINDLAATVGTVVGDIEVHHTGARDGDIEHSCADISRAREQLGYEPSVQLRSGLERLAARQDAPETGADGQGPPEGGSELREPSRHSN
jgi:UDP-glucose 4-epimerase